MSDLGDESASVNGLAAKGVDYEYASLPLTPGVFVEVARTVLAGRQLRRNEISTAVTSYHLDNGGLPPRGQHLAVVKKGMALLAEQGLASPSGGYGIWRIAASVEDDASGAVEEVLAPLLDQVELTGYVYVYDLPAYASLAEASGRDRWPHKIGRTEVSVESRIVEQVGTALPERPRVVVTEACNESVLLERALHAILELRGHKVRDAPGNEWYDTNPTEVRELIDFIRGKRE